MRLWYNEKYAALQISYYCLLTGGYAGSECDKRFVNIFDHEWILLGEL